MTEHLNRAAVRRRLDRLRDEYADLPVRESVGTIPTDHFEQLRADVLDGYTGSGYAWVRRDPGDWPPVSESTSDDAGPEDPTVLLVLERDGDGVAWEVPGGSREDGETYEAAIQREVREETGVAVALEAPSLVSYDKLRSEAGGSMVLHTLFVCFDARYESGSVDVQPSELRGAAWFDAPPASLGPWAQYCADDWWDEYEPDQRWWTDGDGDDGDDWDAE